MSSYELDDKSFGRQYSEDELTEHGLEIAILLQAFYITGSTSKMPYGLDLAEFVRQVISGEFSPGNYQERKVIGYQVVGVDPKPIYPAYLVGFEVFTSEAVDTWLNEHNPDGKWRKMAVYEGDIDMPVFIGDDGVD